MPSFSVLIHADDPDQLGRLLETLRPADEVVVIDHGKDSRIAKVAREHGSTLVSPVPGVNHGAYAVNCRHEWILCLQATESLSEGLEAGLFEWKRSAPDPLESFSVGIREQHEGKWRRLEPETRLVNRTQVNWQGKLPPPIAGGTMLSGDLLRFPPPE